MSAFHRKFTGLMLALAAFISLFGTGSVLAGEGLAPFVPEAVARFSEAQGCVEPLNDMRKNHMEYILHQRDETMHRGIRTKQYSLSECINCHVPEASGDKKVRSTDEKHFCNACHSYAAVSIDCFQCHTDQPTGKPQTSSAIEGAHRTFSGVSEHSLQKFAAGESSK